MNWQFSIFCYISNQDVARMGTVAVLKTLKSVSNAKFMVTDYIPVYRR